MIKQITLSELSDDLAETKTKKKEFLNRIDRIVPCDEWLKIIEPHYHKGERGNKPYDKELMLRLFAQVITLLRKKDLILKKGTIVDSTIISAPSSIKNKSINVTRRLTL